MQKSMETTYTAAAPLASIFIRAIQASKECKMDLGI